MYESSRRWIKMCTKKLVLFSIFCDCFISRLNESMYESKFIEWGTMRRIWAWKLLCVVNWWNFCVFFSLSNIKTASLYITNNCFKWINPRLVWSILSVRNNCKILKTYDRCVYVIRLTAIANSLYQAKLAQSLLKVKITNLRL